MATEDDREAETEWLGEMTPEDSARLQQRPPDVYEELDKAEETRILTAQVVSMRRDPTVHAILASGFLVLLVSLFVQAFRASSLEAPSATPTPQPSMTITPKKTREPVKAVAPAEREYAVIDSVAAVGQPGEEISIEVLLKNEFNHTTHPVNLELKVVLEGSSPQVITANSEGLPPNFTAPVIIKTPYKCTKFLRTENGYFVTDKGVRVTFSAKLRKDR